MSDEITNSTPKVRTIYDVYGSDASAEVNGVWREYGPNSKGNPFRIKVARAGGDNIAYVRALEKHTAPYKNKIKSKQLTAEENRTIMSKVYAEAICKDWEGAENRQGKDVPFSREQVERTLYELPNLANLVIEDANEPSIFQAADTEVISGN